jgi:hypothetical protein
VLYTTNLPARNTGDASTLTPVRPKPRQKQRKDTRMIDNDATTPDNDSTSKDKSNGPAEEPTREEEWGETSEPDAPTGGEENSGMNTILDGGLGTGVQDDIDDE